MYQAKLMWIPSHVGIKESHILRKDREPQYNLYQPDTRLLNFRRIEHRQDFIRNESRITQHI